MQKKKGISLIVLVITIIVMIILAAAIILSLDNAGIINKANQAVKETDLAQIKHIAALAWADAYLAGDRTKADLEAAVLQRFAENEITEKDYEGYTLVVTENGVDLIKGGISVSGVIPKGGVYYVGVTYDREAVTVDDPARVVRSYEGATATYTEGDKFPEKINPGDVYVYGDYEYTYGYSSFYFAFTKTYLWEKNGKQGWGVAVTDRSKTSYGEILSSINGANIVDMSHTFAQCASLTTLPDNFNIPNSVTDMTNTFAYCASLTTLPDNFTIPNGVTNMGSTFFHCTALTALPYGFTIPSSVTKMNSTFQNCSALTALPDGFAIPSSVTNVTNTFSTCTSLTGSITVNANPEEYDRFLVGTQITEITGTTNLKSQLLETK